MDSDKVTTVAAELIEQALLNAELVLQQFNASNHEPPKTHLVIALLLARTISNARGANVLLDVNLVIEARTLVRNCVENLLMMAAIETEGERVLEELSENDLHFRRSLGERLITQKLLSDNERENMRAAIKGVRAQSSGMTRALKPEKLAARSRLETLYLEYSTLSNDAAHPTTASLQFHANITSDRSFAHSAIPLADSVSNDTKLLSASVLIASVCLASEQLGFNLDELFKDMTRRYENLMKFS